MRIEVRRGDIADQPDLDAVVNAANTELWMGGGVAGALKRRGGRSVEEEAKAQGPIPLGEAVVTGAGKLPNRIVIHAAAMGYRPEDELPEGSAPRTPRGSRSSRDVIAACVRRSLELADARAMRSVGFPALATGFGGFPMQECALAMTGAAREHLERHPETKVELVVFVLRDESAVRLFREALG